MSRYSPARFRGFPARLARRETQLSGLPPQKHPDRPPFWPIYLKVGAPVCKDAGHGYLKRHPSQNPARHRGHRNAWVRVYMQLSPSRRKTPPDIEGIETPVTLASPMEYHLSRNPARHRGHRNEGVLLVSGELR